MSNYIKRDDYLNKLIERKENGMIKIITGLRRSGKTFLLFNIFRNYLISEGILESQLIHISLEDVENEKLRNKNELNNYIKGLIKTNKIYYIFIDEVQLVDGFEQVLNGLNKLNNVDIYVTGSNSKLLSSDIITEFRGRGDEIKVFPLSFKEYVPAFGGTVDEAWNEYFTYGGLPMILSLKTDEQKVNYLNTLFEKTYITDIVERNNLEKNEVLESILNILASSIGSLTNSSKLSSTFTSKGIKGVSHNTINKYIEYLVDSFLINKASRFDVKGKRYISTPYKYYFADVGLRNARLNFRQQEENHIMENIIYNELLIRGYNVDVGVVEHVYLEKNGKRVKKQLEIDFVCNQGNKRYYIQSAFAIPNEEKMKQEQESLIKVNDSFKKIIVVKENIKMWRNENGFVIIGLQEFLLNKDSLNL